MEYDIEKLVGEMNFKSNQLIKINKNVMLSNHEIEILKQYDINISHCNSLKEVLFEVENVIGDMEIVDEELEDVSKSISERDYYQNTNK